MDTDEEETCFQDMLTFFLGDRWDTLVFAWSVAGTTTIQWNDDVVAYAHKSHLDDYTRGLKKHVLQLAPVYSELSLCVGRK